MGQHGSTPLPPSWLLRGHENHGLAGTVQSIAGKWGSYGTRFSTGASLSSWAKEQQWSCKLQAKWLANGWNICETPHDLNKMMCDLTT